MAETILQMPSVLIAHPLRNMERKGMEVGVSMPERDGETGRPILFRSLAIHSRLRAINAAGDALWPTESTGPEHGDATASDCADGRKRKTLGGAQLFEVCEMDSKRQKGAAKPCLPDAIPGSAPETAAPQWQQQLRARPSSSSVPAHLQIEMVVGHLEGERQAVQNGSMPRMDGEANGIGSERRCGRVKREREAPGGHEGLDVEVDGEQVVWQTGQNRGSGVVSALLAEKGAQWHRKKLMKGESGVLPVWELNVDPREQNLRGIAETSVTSRSSCSAALQDFSDDPLRSNVNVVGGAAVRNAESIERQDMAATTANEDRAGGAGQTEEGNFLLRCLKFAETSIAKITEEQELPFGTKMKGKSSLRKVDSHSQLEELKCLEERKKGQEVKVLRRVDSDGADCLFEQYRRRRMEDDDDGDDGDSSDVCGESSSDLVTEDSGHWKTRDTDGSVGDKGLEPTYVLSSGREAKHEEVMQGRVLTIDDEFDQYFSQLLL